MELKLAEKDILIRLLEYCRYLYEEEKERTCRLEKKVEIYTAMLGGGFWVVFTLIPTDRLSALIERHSIENHIGSIILSTLILSFTLFLLSSIFTILVYRVRNFEWLCNPEKRALESIDMKNENEFISSMIADYTIAANRNHEINDKKACLLSKAIFTLLTGIIFLAIGLFFFHGFIYLKGGN
jgi:hypothetical protein